MFEICPEWLEVGGAVIVDSIMNQSSTGMTIDGEARYYRQYQNTKENTNYVRNLLDTFRWKESLVKPIDESKPLSKDNYQFVLLCCHALEESDK